MGCKIVRKGHRSFSGPSFFSFTCAACLLTCVSCFSTCLIAQATTIPSGSQLSASEIAQLQAKAESGDIGAQVKLGKAYSIGDGVTQNDVLAAKWFRRAADQGDATAENELGIMFSLGNGVLRDKQEAAHWYAKAAKQRNPQAMFNLGASYYNGDGVGSNEYAAYAWFLLAQEAGDKAADDAVKRSSATMSKKETADAFMQISDMYDTGEELARSQERALQWARRAAEIDSRAKVRVASQLLKGTDAPQKYGEAFELCKSAAKDYIPGENCLGYMYRNGLGVKQDSAEALKWYQKAASGANYGAMIALAEMYSAGEGTKVDRPAAFIWLIRASIAGVNGAMTKAEVLLPQMSKAEIKHVEGKLRDMRVDPKKLFAEMKATPAS